MSKRGWRKAITLEDEDCLRIDKQFHEEGLRKYIIGIRWGISPPRVALALKRAEALKGGKA